MTPIRWFVVLVVVLAFSPAHADRKFGKQVRFSGIHPVPKTEGGGICHIEGPHVHIYAANKLEYRIHDDDAVFVGDPVAYGWDGEKVAYKGAHPIHVEAIAGGTPAVEYCYLEGPHYHAVEPPEGGDFKLVGDVYTYTGELPRVFVDAKPLYVEINQVYAGITYVRPQITIVAPAITIKPPAPVIVVPHGKFKHKKWKRK